MVRRALLCSLLVAVPMLRPTIAQTVGTARLLVTVVDPSNAGLAKATVTLTGLEDVTRKGVALPATANDGGLAVFENLPPGQYAIQAAFPGFALGLLRNVTVRRGDNRHVIVLAVKALSESVTVDGGQELASSRAASSFGLALSREQIETLSDDPAELQRQLLELAGPDAVIRVDSFEGAQLPPRALIKSVHVTRDQFAAEAESPGSTFVDIVTQPGAGRLSGSGGTTYRANALAGTNPFVAARPPESNRSYNGTVGGTLVRNKSDFSISAYGQQAYITPILNPSQSPARALALRQANDYLSVSGLLNYALTRDQTLRLGIAGYRQHARNQGVGQYDGPERASAATSTAFQIRAQEAGPVGRRVFHNTRVFVTSISQEQRSAVEAPTIIIQDGGSSGGAQVAGGSRSTQFLAASDVDYIRGIHSWRTGIQVNGGWSRSDLASGYLGTYTFADQTAFDAGRPLLYTRTIGDPLVNYFNAQAAVYVQDDVRVSKTLTLSPGVRYTVQTHVKDWSAIAPRFGTTWSPFKNGRTSFRASAGLFYWPMDVARAYEPTLRFDGNHQRQVIIVNPTYPDPGPLDGLAPNKYEIGSFTFQRNVRYSLGVDRTFSPRVRMNVLYAYWHQFQLWRGENLNAPVNGVRPNPAFANIIETRTDAVLLRHDLTANLNVSLFAPSPAGNQARFNWKRLTAAISYGTVYGRQNSDGVFTPPPSGTNATEWGPLLADTPYRLTVSITSTQLRNLTVSASWTGNSGTPYTLTTGVDDNQDGIINDRPAGVALRSLRTASQSGLNLRASYNITRVAGGSASAGSPDAGNASRRYRLSLTFGASNLTNRANYGGYSGKMTSQNFQTPTLVINPRKADLGLTLGF